MHSITSTVCVLQNVLRLPKFWSNYCLLDLLQEFQLSQLPFLVVVVVKKMLNWDSWLLNAKKGDSLGTYVLTALKLASGAKKLAFQSDCSIILKTIAIVFWTNQICCLKFSVWSGKYWVAAAEANCPDFVDFFAKLAKIIVGVTRGSILTSRQKK